MRLEGAKRPSSEWSNLPVTPIGQYCTGVDCHWLGINSAALHHRMSAEFLRGRHSHEHHTRATYKPCIHTYKPWVQILCIEFRSSLAGCNKTIVLCEGVAWEGTYHATTASLVNAHTHAFLCSLHFFCVAFSGINHLINPSPHVDTAFKYSNHTNCDGNNPTHPRNAQQSNLLTRHCTNSRWSCSWCQGWCLSCSHRHRDRFNATCVLKWNYMILKVHA